MATLTLHRDKYSARTTLGSLYDSEDKFICYTLEDTVRACGIKVGGETAIPEGRYKVTMRYSPGFKRDCPVLSNTDDPNLIKVDNVEFLYAMLHGGNKHEDTEGCPLVAYNRNDKDETIQGTAEKEVTKLVQSYLTKGDTYIDIINLPQA